ncbi:MAG: (Fe-S)-binding protein [Deltaproteobacteria bacterium]
MLPKGYNKEIFRAKCNPGFQSVHCVAHLEQDVANALPYINAEQGGFEYLEDPPAVSFRVQGKIITGHPKPKVFEILKRLPESNCRECDQPTRMVFATFMAQGVKGPEGCPEPAEEAAEDLRSYMAQFSFDV